MELPLAAQIIHSFLYSFTYSPYQSFLFQESDLSLEKVLSPWIHLKTTNLRLRIETTNSGSSVIADSTSVFQQNLTAMPLLTPSTLLVSLLHPPSVRSRVRFNVCHILKQTQRPSLFFSPHPPF